MSLDPFAQVSFNDGEELTFQDQNNTQHFLAARLTDQLFAKLIPFLPAGLGFGDPNFPGELDATVGSVARRRARSFALVAGGAYPWVGANTVAGVTLSKNQVAIAPGTLFQLVGDDATGTDQKLIPFTFDGTNVVTIADGDTVHERFDLIQMSLAFVDGTPTSVTFLQDGVKASIDTAGLTAHADTKYRAKVAGLSGDNISLRYQKRASGVGVSYSENGNACLVQYEDAVSTNALIEAAVIANSTLLEILSSGTPGNVMHDPADTFAYTHLTGGADQLLIPQTFNKTHRVQMTLSVKQGVAGVTPQLPSPDAGYCEIAMVRVGRNYVGATTQIKTSYQFNGVSFGTSDAILLDQRIPLGVKVYQVTAKDLVYTGADWALDTSQLHVNAAAAHPLFAFCPGGPGARLLGVALDAKLSGGFTRLNQVYRGDPSGSTTEIGNLDTRLIVADSARHLTFASMDFIENTSILTFTQDVTNAIGIPVWSGGDPCPSRPFEPGDAVDPINRLALRIVSNNNTDQVWSVLFFVAEGL